MHVLVCLHMCVCMCVCVGKVTWQNVWKDIPPKLSVVIAISFSSLGFTFKWLRSDCVSFFKIRKRAICILENQTKAVCHISCSILVEIIDFSLS